VEDFLSSLDSVLCSVASSTRAEADDPPGITRKSLKVCRRVASFFLRDVAIFTHIPYAASLALKAQNDYEGYCWKECIGVLALSDYLRLGAVVVSICSFPLIALSAIPVWLSPLVVYLAVSSDRSTPCF